MAKLSDCTVSGPHERNFISYSGIVSMLLNMNRKKSCGPDDLPNVFLKRYAEVIGRFLFVLFRASLLSTQVPNGWRTARIVPIFKKGNPLSVGNYHPIAVKPCHAVN